MDSTTKIGAAGVESVSISKAPKSQGRPRLSPERPAIHSIEGLGLVMMMQFRANVSDVIPADNTQRRELHVIDSQNTEWITTADPVTVDIPFLISPQNGVGTAFLVDYDQANNASTPAAAVSFDIVMPDVVGPTQPTINSITFVGLVDQPEPPPEPAPGPGPSPGPQPQPVGAARGMRNVTRQSGATFGSYSQPADAATASAAGMVVSRKRVIHRTDLRSQR